MKQMRCAAAHPGLGERAFVRIARNGFGDALNSYPHSMAWFKDRLVVGTTRSNLCLFKVSKIEKKLDRWPVECPDYVYDLDMRAQIWSFDPTEARPGVENSGWTLRARAPWIDAQGERLPRELGYRGMCVFKGTSDREECLYVATYTPARGFGTRILRSEDGIRFDEIPMPEGFDRSVITLRLVVPFKGRLFTSPTGKAGGNPNQTGQAVIYASADPAGGSWEPVNLPGFGDPGNIGIFEMVGCGDYLYAGTGNPAGYQIWRTRAEGPAPYDWDCVVTNGAYRGPLNQGVASFAVHQGLVYAGSGIQHGGIDRGAGIGPAGPELIRIHENGRWDLVVGSSRDTPEGARAPLSGYTPGFNNLFNGYFWQMESHDGWLYLGTFDWTTMLRYSERGAWPAPFRKMIERVGVEKLVQTRGGAELYRSRDGENWLPVTTQGFGNAFNYGIRTLQSTPYGLAVGLVNPFGPRVGFDGPDGYGYRYNPDGGLEIWLGQKRERNLP
ncbi:hypothetical protein EV663_101688 [Rhodovulum bhavnagarense]|uniref:Uncharacterized protein n=1 Tax=Rhodovulum bhavnagarense TaxID=992286 RepID=A0A4R2RLD2_9RHOB|nr:hypothetical protein [Rhodovulum bhavnagarense]TCP63419.1 hypothetical protein EV663_101688 [Rhodovulum bhavnagarense]